MAGRPKGSLNKQTLRRQKRIAGRDPLETLLEFAADKTEDKHFRVECAKAALPYLYPRLNSVEVGGEVGVKAVEASTEELYRRVLDLPAERIDGPVRSVN